MSDTQPESPAGPPVRKRVPRHATVSAVRRLTPHLVRVTIVGPELAALDPTGHTDSYVKLVLGELADGRPLLRTYTVRAVRDTDQGTEWDLDLVVHGDEGVGGPWAARVQPGEAVTFMGPGGLYAPDPDAPWHLFVGDDSALPAIATALEALPAGAVAHAVVEVPGPEDELELRTAADLTLTWVHRGNGGPGLVETVLAAHAAGDLPPDAPHVFLHGEAGFVRDLRRWVRAELAVPRELLSASGYWRRGSDDEDWRSRKRDWAAAVEQDDAALVG